MLPAVSWRLLESFASDHIVTDVLETEDEHVHAEGSAEILQEPWKEHEATN